jgi:hypothetical protein
MLSNIFDVFKAENFEKFGQKEYYFLANSKIFWFILILLHLLSGSPVFGMQQSLITRTIFQRNQVLICKHPDFKTLKRRQLSVKRQKRKAATKNLLVKDQLPLRLYFADADEKTKTFIHANVILDGDLSSYPFSTSYDFWEAQQGYNLEIGKN